MLSEALLNCDSNHIIAGREKPSFLQILLITVPGNNKKSHQTAANQKKTRATDRYERLCAWVGLNVSVRDECRERWQILGCQAGRQAGKESGRAASGKPRGWGAYARCSPSPGAADSMQAPQNRKVSERRLHSTPRKRWWEPYLQR